MAFAGESDLKVQIVLMVRLIGFALHTGFHVNATFLFELQILK